MNLTLREVAELVGGQLSGDSGLVITGASIIRDAQPGEITLADKPKLANALANSSASAVIVPPGFVPNNIACITVEDVHASFARIVMHFRPLPNLLTTGVSPLANVSPTAELGDGVVVHPGATIGDDVVVGAGSVIHSGVRVLNGCRIGAQCTLFPNAVLYEATRLGDRCIIHASAVLGAYGFGYETCRGKHQLSVQLGYVELGDDVEVGACTTIDRGTYGPTSIGEGTKIDNQVMIAHNCRIGRHNLLCSQVGIAGSCTTGDYVVLAGQVGVRDHVNIGDRVIVGAQSGVMSDISAGSYCLGSPAILERDEIRLLAARAKLPEMRRQIKSLERIVESFQESQATFSRPAIDPPADSQQDAA